MQGIFRGNAAFGVIRANHNCRNDNQEDYHKYEEKDTKMEGCGVARSQTETETIVVVTSVFERNKGIVTPSSS